ncbi:MAG: pyridoxal-phosphate dependent enzyme [Candidatus Melainabacteria bacterium]|nr:pyridoxal-phosphate dependent enzyme [Candidatus Melainabacteria bacterium]MBI3308337.1 pyridoxal-phosphate dependent enzyme [Candidatus Melainabacteria bacterium]
MTKESTLIYPEIELNEIKKVHEAIKSYIVWTPLIHTTTLSKLCNSNIYLKLENLQKTGSFKPRGALNKILKLVKEKNVKGVIAASGGNHAQGVAYAASKLGLKSTLVMFHGVPDCKINACRAYGADVVIYGNEFQDAFEFSYKLLKDSDDEYVHPFNDIDIVAGQATVALELYKDFPDIDTVVCSIGGGGLIAGVASTIKQLKKDVKVFGVETIGAESMYQSFKAGKIVGLPKVTSFAEGLSACRVGEITYNLSKKYVDDIFTISDEKTKEAILLLLERQKLLVEPSAACVVAAILEKKVPLGKNTAVILSGGNLDLNRLKTFL